MINASLLIEMVEHYEITNTKQSDLEFIFELFERSIDYQEKKGYPVWRNYDRSAIIRDLENRNQYKLVIDAQTAIVFSVCYTDKIIWRELDNGDSIYLHRIVVNPDFKGKKLFGHILDWAVSHAKQKKLGAIRMDTWATNANIIDYYKGFGFNFIENYLTPNIEELPAHNRNLLLALLEYEVSP